MFTHNNNRSSMSSPQPSTTKPLPLENLDTLQQILSFVGNGNYRFVAATNRRFHEAYSALFPDDRDTYLNASTEALIRFCWEEIHHDDTPNKEIYQEFWLIQSAAKHGNLPGLQFLRSVDCPWDADTCAQAAGNCHLTVLQWCQEHGCPWDRYTCVQAAGNGHLNVLQWCRKHGCRWDAWTYWNASNYGGDHILEYCLENGCPMTDD